MSRNSKSNNRSKSIRVNKDKSFLSETTTPHLKLVVSNSTPVQKKPLSQTRDPNTGFATEIQEKAHSRYVLVAYDPFHRLDCEIALEIRDNEDILEIYDYGEDEEQLEPRAVVCHFPNILAEELNEFVEGDETLYGMIIVQFQMKLLEQLLLFCSDHDASILLVHTDNTAEGHALEIYRSAAIYEDKIPTITGTKTQLVIPTTLENFDNLLDLMDDVNQDFRKMLWEDQSTNPAIREYLKSNPCLKYFS